MRLRHDDGDADRRMQRTSTPLGGPARLTVTGRLLRRRGPRERPADRDAVVLSPCAGIVLI